MKQVSKAIGRKRMLKMADFLDKLPRNKFDFGNIVAGDEKPSLEPHCGSAGCIIGWTPHVYPHLVKYTKNDEGDDEVTINLQHVFGPTEYEDVGEALYGITRRHSLALFTPGRQFYLELEDVNSFATPKQAAKLLRSYVKKYMSE